MTVLLLGAPCSGNRMVARMLSEAAGFPSPWDAVKARVLMPHPHPSATIGADHPPEGVWYRLDAPQASRIIVLRRDRECTIRSQVDAGHFADRETAERLTARAYAEIEAYVEWARKPSLEVTFESFADWAAVEEMCIFAGFDATLVRTVWRDANAKYAGGIVWSDRSLLFPMAESGVIS